MINLTILFLSYIGYQHSPFISSSCLFQKNSKLFSNIFISKSFTNFFLYTYGNSHLPSISFKRSKFSNFISQSIFLQKQIFLTNQIFELTNQYFDEDTVAIWNCIFRKFSLPEQYGAAIYSACAIQLYNVFFDDIVSNGGAFYCENQIIANYLTFQKVKATSSACFISKPENYTDSINISNKLENILIQNAVSDQNFGFSIQVTGCTFLTNSNATKCQAIKSTGIMECQFSNSFTKFVSFSFIESPRNSISLSTNSNQCQYSYCLFYSITYDQYLISTINVTNVCLQFCQFSSTNYKSNKNAAKIDGNLLISTLNCTCLKITKCCFDFKKEEIYKDSIIPHLEIDQNFYLEKRCSNKIPLPNEKYNNNIGYSYQRTPTYTAQLAPSPTHNYFFDQNTKFIELTNIDTLISITFTFLCFLIFLIFCIFIQNNCHYLFRKPRALFNYKGSKEML